MQTFVDCFMLMGTALSLKGGQKLPEMSRPLLQDTQTTTIDLSLSIQEFRVLSTRNMEVEVGLLLNQKWIDPRLGANIKTRKMAIAGQIWRPKITNLVGHNAICHNDETVFWRGFGEEGNVLLSEKFSLKVACTENLKNFPLDKQICELKFGSYRFPAEEVKVAWNLSPVEIITSPDTNQFRLINVSTYQSVDIRGSGNFSTAVVQLTLERHYLHYVQCIALPCITLTLLNYATFWFDLNRRSTRIFINTTTFGATLYYYYVSVCLVQPAPCLKAIDIFVALCCTFSLITLLETLFIDTMCTKEETHFHLKKTACSKEYPKCVYWVEFGMKVFYPVFYVFNLILYSFVYL